MILTTFTHAGGVGKTSIVLNVGYRLGELGYRVLLIDLDPQANLTTWLGVEDAELSETVSDLALQHGPLPEPRTVHGIGLIPSHIDLAELEGGLRERIGGILRLRRALEAQRDQWDVVLIDGPPSLGQLAGFGALAADALLVPIVMRTKGIDALNGLNRMMPQYHELRPELQVGIYVPTMYGNRGEDRELYQSLVRRGFGPMTSPVPQREAAWNRAATRGLPVLLSEPKSDAAEDVKRLTDELIEQLQLQKAEVPA
ncbi:ParA family protein [Deinococcus lacus]|uniref:ParA family protein n=1 Tax=Deinococcus lacus TaxID=392561 RepID=A0ABW1YF99_9DEIO